MVVGARRAARVGLVFVALLAACSSGASEAERSALDQLYADPLFAERPEGVGDVMAERFTEECGPSGQEPAGSRDYHVSGDPQVVVDGYMDLGEAEGWRVKESRSVDAEEPFEGRRAQLILERDAGDLRLVASVNAGLGPGNVPMMVTVAGRVEGASFCA